MMMNGCYETTPYQPSSFLHFHLYVFHVHPSFMPYLIPDINFECTVGIYFGCRFYLETIIKDCQGGDTSAFELNYLRNSSSCANDSDAHLCSAIAYDVCSFKGSFC